MRTTILAILVIAAIAIGGGLIATAAYQAGLAADVTVVQPTTDGTVVAPVVVPTYGWGWHGFGPGFGFFGFLGTLFVLFLLIGLIRFAFRGPRGWGGPGGWNGPGGTSGPGGPGRHPWEARAHEAFDDWHRTAHGRGTEPPTPDRPSQAS
jgi:hypothetical protein